MSLILAGEAVRTSFECRSWLDHGMTFPSSRQRERVAQLIAIHCTAAENGARKVWGNLKVPRPGAAKGLSVHLVIDSQGVAWQFADPVLETCLHIGGLNDRSIGIEVVNSVTPVIPNRFGRPLSMRIVQECNPKPGNYPNDFTRGPTNERLYYRTSRKVTALGLFPAEKATLKELVRVLCERVSIPFAKADERDYVPLGERGELEGVLGHVQVSLRHGDPSLDALDLW